MTNNISAIFELAQGGVYGKDHRPIATGSQDSSAHLINLESMIAVVCDGCGSEPHSEVGAQVGARLFVQSLAKQLTTDLSSEEDARRILNRARDGALRLISLLADNMGSNFMQIINNYFLFTMVGMAVYRDKALFFSFGDGVIIINGETIQLGPFPDNKPPYMSYHLIRDRLETSLPPDYLDFRIHRLMPIEQLNHCLLGTDGLHHFMAAAGEKLPGRNEPVGPIDQFWTQDRFFRNPDMVRRRLFMTNREVITVPTGNSSLHRELGHLDDDTTLIVVRRKTNTKETT